jgi:hypothetical protein
MRCLPGRHFGTNPRKKHAFIDRHLGFEQVWACLLELSFQVIYSSLEQRRDNLAIREYKKTRNAPMQKIYTWHSDGHVWPKNTKNSSTILLMY